MFFLYPQGFKERQLASGVQTRLAWGERLMMSVVELKPHSLVARHRHPHEQMGLVLEGEVEMAIGEERRLLKKGDAYLVPSNVEHSAQTFASASLALDVFSPPREDYM